MIKLTTEQLDELERKARASTPGPWRCEIGSFDRGGSNILTSAPACEAWNGRGYTVICISNVFYRRHVEDFSHISANSPDVTLQLVALARRIAPLELALASAKAFAEEAQELLGKRDARIAELERLLSCPP